MLRVYFWMVAIMDSFSFVFKRLYYLTYFFFFCKKHEFLCSKKTIVLFLYWKRTKKKAEGREGRKAKSETNEDNDNGPQRPLNFSQPTWGAHCRRKMPWLWFCPHPSPNLLPPAQSSRNLVPLHVYALLHLLVIAPSGLWLRGWTTHQNHWLRPTPFVYLTLNKTPEQEPRPLPRYPQGETQAETMGSLKLSEDTFL